MRLSTLLERGRIAPLGAVGADPEIAGAALDSRRVRPGDLFFAIPGREVDGLRFAADAIQRGARAVVAAGARPSAIDSAVAWVRVAEPRQAAARLSRECYGRPDEALDLVGVTGTNGKTTTVHLVASIGAAAGRSSGSIGTIGGAYGGHVETLERTTPEAPEFYRLLAEMRDHGVQLAAAEVSSHALALQRVEGARFRVAAFLNLSADHLDFHGDERSYFAAKARLFDGLGPDAVAVLPADDRHGDELAGLTRARVLRFGRERSADVRLAEEHSGFDGSSAVLETPGGRLPLRSFLLGRHNLDNIVAAAACAIALDLPPESIPAGVLALERVPGRVERVDRGQPFAVVVDYAHTPAALERLLGWLRETTRGRLVVVFGCGGARDRDKRPLMGRAAARLADEVYLTSDNPRNEEPGAILAEIVAGVRGVAGGTERTRTIPDRRQAIAAAIAAARAGDVVVIAGKGHETTQVVGDRVLPFDDRSVAAECLASAGFGRNGDARA